jgi:hypothetical protein
MKLFGQKFGQELNTYMEGAKMGYVFVACVAVLLGLCAIAVVSDFL